MYRVFQRPTDPSGSFRRGVARIRRAPLILMACVSMTACSAIGERLESFKGPNWPSSSSKANSSASAPAPQSSVQTAVHSAGPGHARPRIVTPKQWLQCVPYVTRMPGGVGGAAPRGAPLSRSVTHIRPSQVGPVDRAHSYSYADDETLGWLRYHINELRTFQASDI